MKRFARWFLLGVVAVGTLTSCTDENARPNPAEVEVAPEFAIAGFDYDLTSTAPVNVNGGWWIPAVSYKVGSGVLNPFLDWKAPGNDTEEEGFNTDGDFNYDQHRKVDTNPLPLNIIPTVKYPGDGLLYREVILDVNESNDVPAAQMSFDDFQLYLCDDAGAPTYDEYADFVGGANGCDLIYDIEGNAATTDEYTSGSGSDLDYVVLIPETAFSGSSVDISGCTYNPVGSDCGVWVILKVHTGGFGGDWIAEGGYEEAASIIRPWVEVTKTANPTYKLTYDWMITKVADETLHQLGPGETGTTEYTITVDLDGEPVASNWAVTGDINIYNPSNDDVVVTSVADAIEGIGPITPVCPEAVPFTVASHATVTCTYSYDAFANGDTRLNTATVELEAGSVFEGTASIDWATNGVVTERENATVDAYDTPAGEDPIFLGTVSYDDELPAEFTRERSWTFTVDEVEAVCKLHPNLAEVFGDNDVLLDSDDEEVLVQCTSLDVSKTVETSVDRTWNWTLTKSAAPDWDLFVGESAVSGYEVSVEKVDYTESNWTVEGVITIVNNGSVAAPITSVTDMLTPGGAATVENCEVGGGGVTFTYDLAAGATMTCDYSLALGNGDDRVNVATANLTGGGTFSSDDVDVSFDDADLDAITYFDASVSVYDNFDGGGDAVLGDVDDDTTWQYTHEFTCGESDVYPNTAKMVGSDSGLLDQKSASVTVNCYDLEVSKTADGDFDRDWTWSLEKLFTADFRDEPNLNCVADDAGGYICTASLNGTGEELTAEYQVTVDAESTDDAWKVSGEITITNNHPSRAAELTSVTDEISNYLGTITPDCGGATEVPAGSSIVCTYDTGPISSPDDNPFAGETNTATATQQLYNFHFENPPVADGEAEYSDDESISFSSTPTNETNFCASVDDVLAEFPDLQLDDDVCGDEVPATYTYTRDFSSPEDCDRTFINRATVYPKDLGPEAFDEETLIIECEYGCTLTQGYYKTHSYYGPAPFDEELWSLIGDFDGDLSEELQDEDLFDSGQTWYQVFWTSPSGGNLWIKLAHQWMAAYINSLANGGSPVDAQISAAGTILDNYSAGMDIPKDDPIWSTANDLHSDLASYNEGKAGVLHCTENSLDFLYRIFGPPTAG